MGKKHGRQAEASTLNDRERILSILVRQLATTQLLMGRRADGYRSESYRDRDQHYYVHFAYDQKPVQGDLVVAKTGFVDRWTIGWYVEPLPSTMGGAVIREIGTDVLCNYANESFVPVRGMSPLDLFEGEQREMLSKVYAAFRRGDEYPYRFGGLRFEGQVAVITVREVFGGLGQPSTPFEVRVSYTKRTSVAAILRAMREGGYGTRSFRPEPAPADKVGDA